jgi:hypothetical protein
MKTSDKTAFVQIMTILSETYDKSISEPTVEIYFEILKPFTIKQIQWALKKILSEWSYNKIPAPAEFIKRLDVYRLNEYNQYAMPESLRNEIKALGDPIPMLRDYHVLDEIERRREKYLGESNQIEHKEE